MSEDAGKFKVLRCEENGRCATYELNEEDHTLGNALRHIILKNPEVKFCGYALPHPNERKINLQIQVYSGEAIDALERGLKDLLELNSIVREKLLAAKEQFGPAEIVDSEGEQEDPEVGDVEEDIVETEEGNGDDQNADDPQKAPGADADADKEQAQDSDDTPMLAEDA